MVDSLLRAYRLYGYRLQKMLYFSAVLPSAARSRVSSYCSASLVAFACISLGCAELNFCRYLKDPRIIMRILGLFSSAIGPTLKALCFMTKRESLIELHGILEHLFEEELGRDQETRALVLADLHLFDRPGYTLFVLTGTTLLMLLYSPLFHNIHQFVYQVEPKVYRLTYPTKFPWTVPKHGFLFGLHYLHEILVSWIIMCITGGVDGLFGYYSFQITSVLRAISFRLANPPTERDYSRFLKTCMNKHQQLLRCRAILEDVYGLILLWPILTNAIIMCSLVHDISTSTELPPDKLIMLFAYITLKLIQTFTYAWYGNALMNESQMFRQAIYFSEWCNHDGRHNIKADVMIPMLQKPMTIIALKICPVSIDVFINVMNTTLSYFFLLQALDEDK